MDNFHRVVVVGPIIFCRYPRWPSSSNSQHRASRSTLSLPIHKVNSFTIAQVADKGKQTNQTKIRWHNMWRRMRQRKIKRDDTDALRHPDPGRNSRNDGIERKRLFIWPQYNNACRVKNESWTPDFLTCQQSKRFHEKSFILFLQRKGVTFHLPTKLRFQVYMNFVFVNLCGRLIRDRPTITHIVGLKLLKNSVEKNARFTNIPFHGRRL